MNSRGGLIVFIFGPLVIKGRWLLWILGLLVFGMLFGKTLTAIRMDIPSKIQAIKVDGVFSDASGKKYSKGRFYSVDIIDDYGVIHKCTCDPMPNSNCLDRRTKVQQEILDLLDDRILEKHGAHKAIVTWLNGNRGQVWMYPGTGLFGTQNICYQISDESRTYISYEQSVDEYLRIKNGLRVYALWVLVVCGILAIIIFFVKRFQSYLKEEKGNV